MSNIAVRSEVGVLEAVIVHRPGHEVEMMLPETAQAALYDDIISQPLAAREHDQLCAALRQFATVYELQDLLQELVEMPDARRETIDGLCNLYGCTNDSRAILELSSEELARRLLTGVPSAPSPLADIFRQEEFVIPPMYNAYFTRDVAMCVNDGVIIGAMRNSTRRGEAFVMKMLFTHHPALRGAGIYFDGTQVHGGDLTVEGGDLLVLREDLVLIGHSERTSITGIHTLLERFAREGKIRHVVIQPIPKERAYIHFDMVFTMLDRDLCVIHEPALRGAAARRPVLVTLEEGRIKEVEEQEDLILLLRKLGLRLDVVLTGGKEPLHQAREQWQKGTNFFTMAPGKIIGYGRNYHTYRELEERGFRIVPGHDVLAGGIDLTAPGRVAVAMDGAELSRGGGGCRCMTLPLRRRALS